MFSSLNKTEKLKNLKSNIDSQLIPDDPDQSSAGMANLGEARAGARLPRAN